EARGADDVVQPRTQPAAGDDGRFGAIGIKEEALSRSRLLKQDLVVRGIAGRNLHLVSHSRGIRNELAQPVAGRVRQLQRRRYLPPAQRADEGVFCLEHTRYIIIDSQSMTSCSHHSAAAWSNRSS